MLGIQVHALPDVAFHALLPIDPKCLPLLPSACLDQGEIRAKLCTNHFVASLGALLEDDKA